VRYCEIRPSPDLAAFVHCFWELEGGGDVLAEPIFPDGRIEIVVHLGDRPTVAGTSSPQPAVMVVGQMMAALRLRAVPRVHSIGVRFTPAGARAWLDAPAHEITNCILPADDLRSSASARLLAAIDGRETARDRVAAIEQFLRQTVRHTRRSSPSVEAAISATLLRRGRVSIDRLAEASGLGVRQLERQYLDAVGLTPKAFSRTVRFQIALRALQSGEPPAFVATASGFADQSHLSREFRRFAGVSARDVDLAHVVFVQDAVAPHAAD